MAVWAPRVMAARASPRVSEAAAPGDRGPVGRRGLSWGPLDGILRGPGSVPASRGGISVSGKSKLSDLEHTAEIAKVAWTSDVPLPEALEPALLVQRGPCLGEWFSFGPSRKTALVGRDPSSDFVLDHPSVSRKHASLRLETVEGRPRLRLEDLRSRNGVTINGRTVRGAAVLEPEDVLRLGEVLIRFRMLDPIDCRWAQALSEALTSAKLDPLTGLLTRVALDEQLAAAAERSHRAGLPFSVVMLDIDHFKRVNDTWGHEAGDRVLVAVAKAVQGAIRGTDRAVRYGGEEMTVTLPGADKQAARVVAERIRSAVEAQDHTEISPDLRVTVSAGCALLPPGQTMTEALAAADKALYRAKDKGRNRVELAR
jgi:diguanylate cyclase (GGDEF)-like protein